MTIKQAEGLRYTFGSGEDQRCMACADKQVGAWIYDYQRSEVCANCWRLIQALSGRARQRLH